MDLNLSGMLNKLLNKLHTPRWLFWLLVAVLVLRIPSFFEPYSYGDEMIYLALGEAIRQKIPLYSGIHDNKPPLLYIIAGVAGSLFWFKAILAMWHLVTVYVFWKLTEILFKKNKSAQVVATIIFAILTTIPLLEGNIANAELFMIGPTILAFIILLSKKLTVKNLFLSGILFSVSTLFKVPAAFDIPAVVFLWLATSKLTKKNIKTIAKNTLILAAGFLAPILVTFIWYFLQGAFREYLIAAFLQNVGYLSSFRPGDVQRPFLERNGPLLIRGLITVFGLAVILWKKSKLSKTFVLSTAWLLLTLFAVTLSERPYPHYLIQSVPPISLLLGIFFIRKNFEQILAIIPLSLAFFVPFYFNFWYYPTAPYYERFIKFAGGQMDKAEYLSTFGSHVPRNYQIADYIAATTAPNEQIFVWGDSSAIYALSKRLPPIKYVADYHIRDFSTSREVIEGLAGNPPEIIVVLPEAQSFPEFDYFLRNNYGLVEIIDGAEIWKLLSERVRHLLSS